MDRLYILAGPKDDSVTPMAEEEDVRLSLIAMHCCPDAHGLAARPAYCAESCCAAV